MPLVLKGYSIKDHHYDHYDNYDAINVDKCTDIPIDYDGVIGVPITILKYLWEDGKIHCVYTNLIRYFNTKFDIVDLMSGAKGDSLVNGNDGRAKFYINNIGVYARILIRKHA